LYSYILLIFEVADIKNEVKIFLYNEPFGT